MAGDWRAEAARSGAFRDRLVTARDEHYRGKMSIRQRDFGIRPISIAAGTVKVKDELRIEFDIVPVRR